LVLASVTECMIAHLNARPPYFGALTAPTAPPTVSLHDALPISCSPRTRGRCWPAPGRPASCSASGWRSSWGSWGRRRRPPRGPRSEEHTSELQSLRHLVCRLLLEKKKHATQARFVPL